MKDYRSKFSFTMGAQTIEELELNLFIRVAMDLVVSCAMAFKLRVGLILTFINGGAV